MAQRAVHDSVTVVIPFYGDPEETLVLVRRLTADKPRAVKRIIVSDDCSPTQFPADAVSSDSVSVIRREINGGFGAAVNSALGEVDTPLALVLNSDVAISGGDIDQLVSAADAWQPVVASPQVINADGSPQWSGRHFPRVHHQTVEWLTPLVRFRHLPRLHEAVGHDVSSAHAEEVTPVDWVMGAVMLIPVKEFQTLGGFDERFFMNCEEVDLQKRLRQIGVPSIVVPCIEVQHAGGGSSDPQLRRKWLVESRSAYAEKWGHPRTLALLLHAASATNFAANLLRRSLGNQAVEPLAVLRQEKALIRGSR